VENNKNKNLQYMLSPKSPNNDGTLGRGGRGRR